MKKLFAAAVLLLSTLQANAYTECKIQLDKLYVGDNGNLYLFFTNGGAAGIGPNDINQKNAMAVGLTAFTTGKPLIVRYTADGVNCGGGILFNVLGIWLTNS